MAGTDFALEPNKKEPASEADSILARGKLLNLKEGLGYLDPGRRH